MSYFGGTWRGDDDITRDERALELFTDRDKAVRLFSEYLNDDPPRRRVLYFYGDGGNGKSLLLKFLLRNYCRRLARGNWEFVRGTAEEDFARHLRDAQGARPVPYALLDFGLPAAGDEQPLQAFSGLLRLRRTLAESAREANYALRFPLYDFACLSYLRKTGGLTAERYRRLFPDEESEFVGEMVNAISNTSWGTIGKAVLGVFGKHAGEWYALYKHRRRLDEEQVERIHRLDPDAGLLDRLPFFFAEDLGVVLGAADAPERVLLAFDRHEAFWGFQRNLSDKPFFDKDKWLRQLLGAILDLPEGDGAGVVALVAGREAPRWSEAGEFNIPREFVETFLVGHLPEAHAAQYLERAGVSGEEMRRSLVAHARVAPGEVHPLRLGMCADVFLAAERKGEPLTPESFPAAPGVARRMKELMGRLLQYVDVEVETAILALSACRAFDFALYDKLGRSLHFAASEPTFRRVLTRFSFVGRAEQRGEGWYSVHEILRRLAQERADEEGETGEAGGAGESNQTREVRIIVRRAHRCLLKHYRRLGDAAAVAESIYHASRLEPERAVYWWLATFEDAMHHSDYELCRALLGVRGEMFVGSRYLDGRISQEEADYHAALARHEEARAKYLEAIGIFDGALRDEPESCEAYNHKGTALLGLGELQAGLSAYDDATRSYQNAVTAFEEALRRAPRQPAYHNHKGLAFMGLGKIQAGLSQHDGAARSYNAAVASYDEALALDPGHFYTYHNKGQALAGLGSMLAEMSRHKEAIIKYSEAVAVYQQCLELARDYAATLNNKGLALQGRGESYAGLGRDEDAVNDYRSAVSAYDAALRAAPDFVNAHNSKGLTLARLGEAQTSMARLREAEGSYDEAIRAFGEALRRAPDHVNAHLNKGLALARLGRVAAVLHGEEEALECFEAAVAACEEALGRAPDYVGALLNYGLALRSLAGSQAHLGRHEQAVETSGRAVVAYKGALKRAPGYAKAHGNLADALITRGESQAALLQFEDAAGSYLEGVAACDRALALAPDEAYVHTNKGTAFEQLGELHAGLTRHDAALGYFKKAIAAYGESLKRAPDPGIHAKRGGAYAALGESCVALSRVSLKYRADAVDSFIRAADCFEQASGIVQTYPTVAFKKGFVLARLGELQAALARYGEAVENFERAVAAYEEGLRCSPDEGDAHFNKALALDQLGRLQAGRARHEEAAECFQKAACAFAGAIKLSPEPGRAYTIQGVVLTKLAESQTALGRRDDAVGSYVRAGAAFDEALKREPDYGHAQFGRAVTLYKMGLLQAELSRAEAACVSLRAALAQFSLLLEASPGDEALRRHVDGLRKTVEGLCYD